MLRLRNWLDGARHRTGVQSPGCCGMSPQLVTWKRTITGMASRSLRNISILSDAFEVESSKSTAMCIVHAGALLYGTQEGCIHVLSICLLIPSCCKSEAKGMLFIKTHACC